MISHDLISNLICHQNAKQICVLIKTKFHIITPLFSHFDHLLWMIRGSFLMFNQYFVINCLIMALRKWVPQSTNNSKGHPIQ
jgi:hypothetical protein